MASTVQAHSAFGVGSAVDSGSWANDLGVPQAAIGIFSETNTDAASETSLVSALTWNPTATVASGGNGPCGLCEDLNVNLDGQTTADTNNYGIVAAAISNGNTTALGTLSGGIIFSYSNGNAFVQNQYALQLSTGSYTGGAGTVAGLQNNVNITGPGTVTGAYLSQETLNVNASSPVNNTFGHYTQVNLHSPGSVVGDDLIVEYDGTSALPQLLGQSIYLGNLSTGGVMGDVVGSQAVCEFDGGTNQDCYSYVSSIKFTAGTLRTGFQSFYSDGADSIITATAPNSIASITGFHFTPPSLPTGVVTEMAGLFIDNVIGATDNFEIISGTAPSTFAGPMEFSGITGHGTAGVVGIDASGNLSALSAPTISAANMTSFPASLVTTADTQTLTNKTVDGVTPTVFGYIDPTSSIQTQLNGKQASGTYVTAVSVATANGDRQFVRRCDTCLGRYLSE